MEWEQRDVWECREGVQDGCKWKVSFESFVWD